MRYGAHKVRLAETARSVNKQRVTFNARVLRNGNARRIREFI